MCGEKGTILAMPADSKKSDRRSQQALRSACRPCPAPCYFENLAIRTTAQKSNFKTCEIVRTKKSLLTKLFIFTSVQFFQYFGAAAKNTLKNALAKKNQK